jgi:hypothetical protein
MIAFVLAVLLAPVRAVVEHCAALPGWHAAEHPDPVYREWS